MKNILVVIVVLALLAGVGWWVWGNEGNDPSLDKSGHKNAAYSIDGQSITLKDGYAETESAPGSASKTVTLYFGNEAWGDLNDDGKEDVAFILTQTSGGSGTFYYLVAALYSGSEYQGLNGVLLGDRIAPQSTDILDGSVVVNYADRAPGEPMTNEPSQGVTKYIRVVGNTLTASE